MLRIRRSSIHLAILMAIAAAPAVAQESGDAPDTIEQAGEAVRGFFDSLWTPRSLYTDSPEVQRAFREPVAAARRATVRIRVDDRNRSLGGVVGPDGWVLTKASRLTNGRRGDGKQTGDGRVTVRLNDGRELDARTVGVDRDYDLAMLKVNATNLPTLQLDGAGQLAPGDWVATVGPSPDPVAVGVVSVLPRKIKHRPGILGVLPTNSPGEGVLVVSVSENTGAEAAGMLANDRVTAINGTPVRTPNQLRQAVQQFSPGETVEVTFLRGGESQSLLVTLTGRDRVIPMNRSQYQNSLGGKLSQRRFGFPKALQHDSKLTASECGGPLVDLDGNVVGFNLARSGRTESYAVPTSELPERLFALMNGSQPPTAE